MIGKNRKSYFPSFISKFNTYQFNMNLIQAIIAKSKIPSIYIKFLKNFKSNILNRIL
jgi:hypothetical protein